MEQVTKEISQFAKQVFGFDDLAIKEKGVNSFKLGTDHQLSLEIYGSDLLVYINQKLQRNLNEKFKYALECCHFSNPQLFPVQVGLAQRDVLVFALHLPLKQVNAAKIKQAVDYLFAFAAQVRAK